MRTQSSEGWGRVGNELRLPRSGKGARLIRSLRGLIHGLDLDRGDLIVAGSARLWAEGVLPDLSDLDIVARGRSLYALEDHAGREGSFSKGRYSDRQISQLHGIDMEIAGSWVAPNEDIDELIAECEVIDGLQFIGIPHVIAYKVHLDREKDREHLHALFSLSGLGRRHGWRPIRRAFSANAEGNGADSTAPPRLHPGQRSRITAAELPCRWVFGLQLAPVRRSVPSTGIVTGLSVWLIAKR